MGKNLGPENYPPLWAWLKKHEARCAWTTKVGTLCMEGWMVGSGIAIITLYPNGRGWDVATSSPYQSIELSLTDAEERLGLGKGKK